MHIFTFLCPQHGASQRNGNALGYGDVFYDGHEFAMPPGLTATQARGMGQGKGHGGATVSAAGLEMITVFLMLGDGSTELYIVALNRRAVPYVALPVLL
jgi:hypothetical protein